MRSGFVVSAVLILLIALVSISTVPIISNVLAQRPQPPPPPPPQHPHEWSQLTVATGKGSPYVGEILDKAFSIAYAVIVLMTPDDLACLKKEFRKPDDLGWEIELTGQARPNVLFEAGMAMGRNPDRTILVEAGSLRPFSDVGGRHVVRLDDSIAKRQDLAKRLEAVGCTVDLSGTDWHTAGTFSIHPLVSDSLMTSAKETSPPKKELEKIDMQEAKRIALEHVGREGPESEDVKVDSTELVGKDWHVSGHWTEKGTKSFATIHFDVVIDSQTKEIRKSDFKDGFAMAIV